jgi:hypothetical protein
MVTNFNSKMINFCMNISFSIIPTIDKNPNFTRLFNDMHILDKFSYDMVGGDHHNV